MLPAKKTYLAAMLGILPRTLEFLRRHGARRFASCIFCLLVYRALRQLYRFDPWHSSTPYPCYEYKFRAADLASSTDSRVVLDIGCGLGDIIGHVRAEKRWGVDISPPAIAAARRLFGRQVSFAVGSGFAPDEIARKVTDRPIDLVIITGWTHGMDAEQLIATIRSIQLTLSVRMLLIDSLHPRVIERWAQAGTLERSFSHSIEDLARLGEVRSSVDCGDAARSLHLIALTP